jgi:hypothetical protein
VWLALLSASGSRQHHCGWSLARCTRPRCAVRDDKVKTVFWTGQPNEVEEPTVMEIFPTEKVISPASAATYGAGDREQSAARP